MDGVKCDGWCYRCGVVRWFGSDDDIGCFCKCEWFWFVDYWCVVVVGVGGVVMFLLDVVVGDSVW